jgi:hypothetical protein
LGADAISIVEGASVQHVDAGRLDHRADPGEAFGRERPSLLEQGAQFLVVGVGLDRSAARPAQNLRRRVEEPAMQHAEGHGRIVIDGLRPEAEVPIRRPPGLFAVALHRFALGSPDARLKTSGEQGGETAVRPFGGLQGGCIEMLDSLCHRLRKGPGLHAGGGGGANGGERNPGMHLAAEQPLHRMQVAVISRIAGDRLQAALSGQEAEPDGIALVDEIAHVLQAVTEIRPSALGLSVGQRRHRGGQAAEGGGVVQLAVGVLVGLHESRNREVGRRSAHPPSEPVVAAPCQA